MSDPSHPESAESLARARRYFAESVEELEEAGAERMTWTMSKDSSQRLDKYVQGRLKGISRSQVQKLIDLGAVTVNAVQVTRPMASASGAYSRLVSPAPNSAPGMNRFHKPSSRASCLSV